MALSTPALTRRPERRRWRRRPTMRWRAVPPKAMAGVGGRRGAATVRSDWCHSGTSAHLRPSAGEHGWLRVEVTGEVFGPFSALWPGRLDRVHATAAGPAVLSQASSLGSSEPISSRASRVAGVLRAPPGGTRRPHRGGLADLSCRLARQPTRPCCGRIGQRHLGPLSGADGVVVVGCEPFAALA